MKFFLQAIVILMGTTTYALPNLECTMTYKTSQKECDEGPVCDPVLQDTAIFRAETYENGNKYYTSSAIGQDQLKYARVSFYKKENFYGQLTDSVSLQIWDTKARAGTTLHSLPVTDINTVIPGMTLTVDQPEHLEFFDLRCKVVAEEEKVTDVIEDTAQTDFR